MKRLLNIGGSLLGLLALAALAAALALTLGGTRKEVEQPPSLALQSPKATAVPVSPITTPTPLSIPRCAFGPGPAPTEAAGPSLDAYVFSEPRVVLTHTSAIGIAGWLPDGRRLLITRLVPPALSNEYIETINIQTGELQSYGEWHGFSAGFNPRPIWLDSEQAVAFTDLVNKQWVLRIGRGKEVKEVFTGMASPYVTASPDGKQVAFLSRMVEGQPQIFDMARNQQQGLPFTLPMTLQPDSVPPRQSDRVEPYQAAWRPTGNQVAFYNDIGFYLSDLTTQQVCEVELGPPVGGKRWAVDARWSPNGHYLAALTTIGEPIVPFVDLSLLDTSTGEVRHINLKHQYLSALAWSTDSRTLLVIAEADRGDPARANQYELYLVDASTGNSRQMLKGYPFLFAGVYGTAWSPDGQAIALACPTAQQTDSLIAEGRLCIIAVESSKDY